jgi:calcineurin-like phosphoesterase family protein
MSIYFTSDPHYWHNNVIRYCSRPYSTVEEMNEDMLAKWNSVVKPEDTVYCLGDFSLAFRGVEIYSFRLNGTRYLVPGNHDFCHSYHKHGRKLENLEKWTQKYKDYGWNILPEQTTLSVGELGIVNLCHHPYGDENSSGSDAGYQDKYARWRPLDDGKVLLCGHIHEKWHTKKSSKGTLMVNVGVDVNGFLPISEEEVIRIVNANR